MINVTDEQIIKALECCKGEYTDFCFGCPAYHLRECMKQTNTQAINLINRQNAEIERLHHYKQSYEDLKAEHLETIKAIKQDRIEAIKEFAEKLDKILCLQIGPSKRVFWKITEDVKNLVEEMVGDGNA